VRRFIVKQDVDESVAIDRLASPVEHEVSIRGIYAREKPQARSPRG